MLHITRVQLALQYTVLLFYHDYYYPFSLDKGDLGKPWTENDKSLYQMHFDRRTTLGYI